VRLYDSEARQDRAERILDAARDLLLKWGYKRVTIDDIATAAGIGKGTVYLHWKTREELYLAVMLREYGGSIDEMIDAIRRDPREALLHRMARMKYVIGMKGPLLRSVLGGQLEQFGKVAGSASPMRGTRLDVISADYVRLLVDNGTIKPGYTPDELFYAVGAITAGFYVVDAMIGGMVQTELALDRKADLMEAAIRKAFEVEPPPGALEVIAPAVLKILGDAADLCRVFLRNAYEGRSRKEESL